MEKSEKADELIGKVLGMVKDEVEKIVHTSPSTQISKEEKEQVKEKT